MKSKILILGAAGKFGSCFSKYLLNKGHYVYGVDNFSSDGSNINNLDVRVDLAKVDLSNLVRYFEPLDKEIKDSVCYIFVDSIDLNPIIDKISQHDYIKKVVFVSSQNVYPIVQNATVDDVNFKTTKGKEYKVLEEAVKKFSRWTILRPLNVISKDKLGDTFLDNWFRDIQEEKTISVSDNFCCITPVEFYNQFLYDCMEDFDNQIVNLSSSQLIPQINLFKYFNEACENWGYPKIKFKQSTNKFLTYNMSELFLDKTYEEIPLQTYIFDWVKQHSK